MNPQEEIRILQERVELLENFVADFVYSDRYIFQKNIQIQDGRYIQFALGTGTKIGTSTAQKFSFHNATPVAQRSGAAQAAVPTTPATTGAGTYGYTQTQADAIVTLLNELRAADVEKGLIKGSA